MIFKYDEGGRSDRIIITIQKDDVEICPLLSHPPTKRYEDS